MTDKEMRVYIRAEIIKKYGRIKPFCYDYNVSPSRVSFWLAGRIKMPVWILDMFGLERVVTVEYKEASCTAATEQSESQS